MPFGDGTGPMGNGRMGLGLGRGRGRGFGRGRGRGFGRGLYRGAGARILPVNSVQDKTSSVKDNALAEEIYRYLPKINCGACGYPTCEACAIAISKGEAPYNACRVLKPEQHLKIKEIIERR